MHNSQLIIEDCLYLFVITKGNAIRHLISVASHTAVPTGTAVWLATDI